MSREPQTPLRRFARRYATFAAARIALIVGRWFVLVQSARHLPTSEFAMLAAALSIAEILRALSDVGADGYVYSRLGSSGQRLRATVSAVLAFRGLSAVTVAVVGGSIHATITGRLDVLPVFGIIVAGMGQATGVALLQKQARFGALALLVAITLVASATVDLATLLLPATLARMSWLMIAPDCIAAITALSLAGPLLAAPMRRIRAQRRSLFSNLRPVVGKLLPGGIVSVLVVAYSRLDVMIVLPLAGVTAQAEYSAGFRLVEPAFLFFAIASLALLAELGSGRTADTRRLAQRLLDIPTALIGISLPLAAVLAAVLTWAVSLHLFGLGEAASGLAALFAAALPFRIGNSMISALLLRLGRFDGVMHAAILNAFITFSAATLLTLWIGAPGAAVGALGGEIVNAIYQRRLLRLQLIQHSGTTASI